MTVNNPLYCAGPAGDFPKEKAPGRESAAIAGGTADKVAISIPRPVKADELLSLTSKKLPGLAKKAGERLALRAEKTAEYLDDHVALKGALDGASTVMKGLKAFPKFIYPVFRGMTVDEAGLVLDALDSLPLKDVNSVKRIVMVPEMTSASGFAFAVPPDPFIHLARNQTVAIDPTWARTVAIHEVGHTKDFSTGPFGLMPAESMTGSLWGKPPYISDYAKTHRVEDFAESYATYHMNPSALKEQCPAKYERIRQLEELGPLDRLIDQPAFRDTGKFLGKAFGAVPYLRTGLSLLSFLTGFVQLIKGIGELRQASKSGDAQKKMEGTLDVAAGSCFASKLFCVPGLALDGAKQALVRAINEGDVTAAEANAAVQSTVGALGGPLAAIGNWIRTRIFGKKLPAPAPQASNTGAPQGGQHKPDEKPAGLRGSLKAACIGAGGAAGTLTGGLVGPYLGLLAGYNAAGPVGGAIGLFTGCLMGVYAGNKAGGDLGCLAGGMVTGT
ncbi:MAG: hypothetical protein RDV48_21200 [Candidatus Eremiobacteraeota bacterium]|nr:hypothetical protein [Candidatus Eremiobacteraeota bacterium]